MEPIVRRHFWRLHKRLKYYSNSNDKSGKSNKILISYDLKIKDKWKVQTENHVDKLDFIH